MSGRGCTITVQLDNPRRDLKLSVGLHTPLHVLKTQLARVTNIRESNQVLILLDLSDPMRNSDVMLEAEEVDRYSLREIGICEGSTLSLHFIRAPAGAASASMSVGEDGSPRRRARGIGAASGGRSSRDAAERQMLFTSSRSSTNAMFTCPSPFVYFPTQPSCASIAVCST